ncbi:GumC family protein [Saccharicrinis sp. FJH62]|uniref:GumC family protein n=1 Tax=Saccharicrinis sp. FJH62 TaxID=3344657 RepID=UPI0035D51FCD
MMKKEDSTVYTIEKQLLQDDSEVIYRYLKRWPWFIALSVIGIILGFAKYKSTPPTYEVSTKIIVKGESNPLKSSISVDNIFRSSTNSNMSNQLEILQSYTNYRKALENLNWQVSWFTKGKYYDKEVYGTTPAEIAIPLNAKNIHSIAVNVSIKDDESFIVNVDGKANIDGEEKEIKFEKSGVFGQPFVNEYYNFILYRNESGPKGNFYFVFNNFNRMAQNYLKKVQVDVTNTNSDVIQMTLTGTNPQKEADFLNELNSVFITLGLEEEERDAENSVSFISDQLTKLKDSLDRSEKAFTDYRSKNQVVDLSQEADFIYKKLEDIESERYDANMRLNYYTNIQNYIDDSDKIKQISTPSVAGIDDNNLEAMLTKLTELYNRREILSYSVKEKSPSYILVEKEINLIKNSLKENLNNLISNTKSEISEINKRNREIQARLEKLPKTEKELIGIQREFELNSTMYNYMLKKKAEAELSQASTAPKVQVIDKALPESATQIGPNMKNTVAIGLGVGLAIPFLIIYLLETFSSTVRTKDEVDRLTELPVIDGIILSTTKDKLPVIKNPRSGLAESFRALRYRIKKLVHENGHAVISVNSMMPGEGKSFVSSNLAAIFAMNDKKVLLVGADIRKPKLDVIFDTKDTKGLTDFLSGNLGFNDVIIETKVGNLYFTPAGEVPPNPTELLEKTRLSEFIREAKSKFDFIILDNAPFSLVSDGLITSNLADLTLIVVRINKSRRKNIQELDNVVQLNKLENVSVLVNGLNGSQISKGYVKKGYGVYSEKYS